jgi:hypothetical protein
LFLAIRKTLSAGRWPWKTSRPAISRLTLDHGARVKRSGERAKFGVDGTLYQLLHAQYGLNPNGEKSFGNAVEECQGGIHYILGRYHTVSVARKFWESHHWY